ncbi:MAG: C40 family peptidase [Ferrimicrobium sp.]
MQTRTRSPSWQLLSATVLVGAVVVMSVASAPSVAYAGQLQSAKGQAAAIAAKIATLDNQVQLYAEQYDQAQSQLSQTQYQIGSLHSKIAGKMAEVSILQRKVVVEAVTLFTQAGSDSAFLTMMRGTANSAAVVQEDISTASALQHQALVSYVAAQQQLHLQQLHLRSVQAQQQTLMTQLGIDRTNAQSAQQQAQTQLSQVDAQIQQLVVQRQAAVKLAQEQAAAAAIAQQQAAAAAIAQQQAAVKLAQQQAAAAAATAQRQLATQQQVTAAVGTDQQVTPIAPQAPTSLTQQSPPVSNAANAAALYAIQIANANDTNYVWAGAGEWINGVQVFDCSGLVQYVYAHEGIYLPHNALMQANDTTPISYSQLQPGDLVFYDTQGATSIDHVSIYIGGGQVVEATDPGRPVSIDPITWSGTPVQYGAPS